MAVVRLGIGAGTEGEGRLSWEDGSRTRWRLEGELIGLVVEDLVVAVGAPLLSQGRVRAMVDEGRE